MEDTITIKINNKNKIINIQKIVETIIKYSYNRYGTNIMFKDIDYSQRIIDNIIYYTNLTSCGYVRTNNYTYSLKLYMEDQIRYTPTTSYWTKCIYCDKKKLNKKKCDVVFNCCNYNFHYQCGRELDSVATGWKLPMSV